MKRLFPLFQSHIDQAHAYWSRLINADDLVIDATCGNGRDSLFLADLGPGRLLCLDIQKEAVETTRALLKHYNNISCFEQCHSSFPEEARPDSVKLIVYNLGYLPGGDKSRTTERATTIASLNKALDLIVPGGVVSVTCYPGHSEGAAEEKEILLWAERLSQDMWNVCLHRFVNRTQSPSLILIQKNF